ncbi:LOW QUALITY PROTEIN: protein prenyltransferase alpha subunit repeat-containing protein 1 [Monomorium pharaonis]|uniref:LOW QUALITY PROTEIN: protein prenyltransferase alpha subunit repeat-containing protein 1 n=1 Tax=Monomorium pharaonis TaxID=307658 RepID=UPI00102E21D0|nr:LOW QUALITY PROTEIN: protein prenyltransferase alpha subunit repeat-containing protein 1 [Monomorium pharaonis]
MDAARTMVDNEFPAAEKILRDIENTIRRNPTIRSFVILPMEDSENRSPVFHQEDSLGLASWCVQPLYVYTYRRLLEYRRTRHQRREEPSTVARWLLGALLFNPSVTMFWNMRRELVRAGRLDPRDELSFTRPVLYHTPKCFEAFSYRGWLMPFVLDAETRTDVAEALADDELELVQTCADRYANNYHAWSYRRHLVTLFESRGLRRLNFDSEWMSILVWCRQHVSDHSAYSYRQFLLRKYILAMVTSGREAQHDNAGYRAFRHDGPFLYMGRHELDDDERTLLERIREVARLERDHGYSTTDVRKLRCYLAALSYWTEECLHNEQYITVYDNHETLWCHRRFLAYLIAVLTATYAKHACYREDDFWDSWCHDDVTTLAPLLRNKRFTTDDDLLMAAHVMLVKSFCSASVGIIEVAIKRPQEKVLIERFCKYLERIGLR